MKLDGARVKCVPVRDDVDKETTTAETIAPGRT
jgi:hypothetical protein